MLSSSELLSCCLLYLLSTGSDAVTGILNDLAAPIVVLSCIVPTSLQTLSNVERKSLTIMKILKGWASSLTASPWKYSVSSFTNDKEWRQNFIPSISASETSSLVTFNARNSIAMF